MISDIEIRQEIINSKKIYLEWCSYEKEKYLIHGIIDYYLKLLYGNESAVIWKFQHRLRKTEYFLNTNKTIRYHLSNIMLNRYRNRYGLHIGLNVCGKGLKIMHLGAVLTNGNVKIGQNVSIHINTSFVAKGVNDGVPKISDGCVIGVGATIVGDIFIARNISVGANSVVCKNIYEENIAIAGNPAKKVSENGRLEWNNDKNE